MTTNHMKITNALEILRSELCPFVEREIKSKLGQNTTPNMLPSVRASMNADIKTFSELDIHLILKIIWENWNDVFSKILGRSERSLISELRDFRNKWAHQQPFNGDDTYRMLDSASRLLSAISSTQSSELDNMKKELLRVRFDQQVKDEKKKSTGSHIESESSGFLKPWREVIYPHQDVASGRFQSAEYAADLWQIYQGEGNVEYLDPKEFYRRTYLTSSLKKLLVNAIRRLSNSEGDPVIQLQTNFGGGKTHSMLALYHLFSGSMPSDLTGVEEILEQTGIAELPNIKRVVLVGTKISPGNPSKKEDGTEIKTLWGEIAWQLGGIEAFNKIRADDENATNPGDALRKLFNEFGPVLLLIDEWVAYARQLHDQNDLPAGNFETHFSFVQALSESAKAAKNCLLVVSLPASETGLDDESNAEDVEVGGQRGHAALDRLRNAIGRVESAWRPASAEEAFEIVSRRLFEPIVDEENFLERDKVVDEYTKFYQQNRQEFPAECSILDYGQKIKVAYPIHPEVFKRLYGDWSTLVKFQRTRGVLRLMSTVIHCLWNSNDKSPLIQPANIPIDDERVRFELLKYLPEEWGGIIEKDVDGANSLPVLLDGEVPNFGKYSACRRISRTIYLGTAPGANVANKGIEDKSIKLGSVIPSEPTATFGDALRRLSSTATFLYQDGTRYWYSTQPTVTKLAEDKAEEFKSHKETVANEIQKQLQLNLKNQGEFLRVYIFPESSHEVSDVQQVGLVVLHTKNSYSKDPENSAQIAANEIIEKRGEAPRASKNTLVFLAPDQSRVQNLEESIRRYLAWNSILKDSEYDLKQSQIRQAEEQIKSAESSVLAQLSEVYRWLLIPQKPKPQPEIEWQYLKLSGNELLAERASRKLIKEELLATDLHASRLRLELDQIPLWRENHVSIEDLINDFTEQLYLPRLKEPSVLLRAISNGIKLLTWKKDSFAYAENFDIENSRYQGLSVDREIYLSEGNVSGLVVKSEIAQAQIDKETETERKTETVKVSSTGTNGGQDTITDIETNDSEIGHSKYFQADFTLDTTRVGRDASEIAEGIISKIASLESANVTVKLKVEAKVPNGVPVQVEGDLRENCKTLKSENCVFEDGVPIDGAKES